MLAYCNFYHEEIRLLGQEPGDGQVVRRLCPECREHMERIIDRYVEQLTHRYDSPQGPEAAGH